MIRYGKTFLVNLGRVSHISCKNPRYSLSLRSNRVNVNDGLSCRYSLNIPGELQLFIAVE